METIKDNKHKSLSGDGEDSIFLHFFFFFFFFLSLKNLNKHFGPKQMKTFGEIEYNWKHKEKNQSEIWGIWKKNSWGNKIKRKQIAPLEGRASP